MIKSIEIKNFESHKDTKLIFDQGVNVIYGESDQGKSAIIRALLWVVTNRPSGNSFCSRWGGDTSVTIEMDNCFVSRIKDKKHKYIINYKDGTVKEFEAVAKQGVPLEVQKVLNINPINIQTQFDGHFLLPPMSPGEVARQINQYVNLDIIDTTMSNSSSTIKETKRRLATLEAQTDAQKKEIDEKYAGLDDEEQCLNSLESLEKRIASSTNTALELEELSANIHSIHNELDLFSYVDEAEHDLKELESVVNKLSKSKKIIFDLQEIKSNYESAHIKLILIKDRDGESELLTLDSVLLKLEREEEKLEKLKGILYEIETIKNKIIYLSRRIKHTDEQFHKHMPDICPTCGQRTKK